VEVDVFDDVGLLVECERLATAADKTPWDAGVEISQAVAVSNLVSAFVELDVGRILDPEFDEPAWGESCGVTFAVAGADIETELLMVDLTKREQFLSELNA